MSIVRLILTTAVVMGLSACRDHASSPMTSPELKSACLTELNSYGLLRYKSVNIREVEILAWYRDRDPQRPWNVDCALCWASVDTNEGPKWSVFQMARNPDQKPGDPAWHSYFVFDAPNDWFIFYDKPPKNSDIYSAFSFFDWKPRKGWVRYDSFIDSNNWKRVIGEHPTRAF